VPGDEQRLLRRHRAGARHARTTLIERYLPLARALALRYRRSPEEVDDLVQVASLGLVKAVDRWDPDRGVVFTSFAIPTILGELRHHLRDRSWCVRPPRRVQDLSQSIDRAQWELRATTGREPTIAQLANRLGRSRDDVTEAVLATQGRTASSLDAPRDEDDAGSEAAVDALSEHDPGYARVDAKATIERLTAVLDERARAVLCLSFELDLVQSQIAAAVGISQMHVSRTLAASLEALRTQPGARALMDAFPLAMAA
jgi:RNA polymerase sigma-B factor